MSNNDNSSSSDDEWDTAGGDLVLPADEPSCKKKDDNDQQQQQVDDNDDDGWDVKLPVSNEREESNNTVKKESNRKNGGGGEPMIIVDMTALDPSIHNKFDKNSVNDTAKASKLRKKIESSCHDYYVKNPELLASGTVIPCGSSVYRQALIQLRNDKPGHYFCAIFPPKK